MRYFTIVLIALALCGCVAQQGPGAACDECAVAEANPVGPGNNQAAAAAASGGQRSNNAPFAEDTARLSPQTTVGRGAGDTSATSSDTETREVASGGAQNIGLFNPATATASNEGGGVSVAVQEAAKNVAAARRAYQVAVMDPTTSDARLTFLADEIVRAQEMLNGASATSRTNVTNNYHMGGDNTLIGVSTSKTGKQDSIDPKVVQPLSEGAAAIRAEAAKDAKVAPEASPSGGSSDLGSPPAAPEGSDD